MEARKSDRVNLATEKPRLETHYSRTSPVFMYNPFNQDLTDATDEIIEEIVREQRLLQLSEEELQCSCDHMDIPVTLLQVQILWRNTEKHTSQSELLLGIISKLG